MLPSPKSKIWNYNENEMMIIDPNITWTPTYHFYEDIATYCQLQKIALHPCFLREHYESPEMMSFDSKDLNLKKGEIGKAVEAQSPVVGQEIESILDVEEDSEPEILNIFTKKIDKNSIHALFAVLPYSKIHTLKFSNNAFEYLNLKLLISLLPSSHITRFYLDWNPIPKSTMLAEEAQSLLSSLLDHTKLECLYMRSNGINDQMLGEISEKLKSHPSLICLDLSRNPITKKGIEYLTKLLESNTIIQYIGLSKINISIDDLKPLIEVLGRNLFPQEDVDAHLKMLKERDAIIERIKKGKGKKEEIVPNVEEIEQIGEEWYIWKNTTLKHLNLALNGFDESSVPILTKLLEKTADTFGVTTMGKPISREIAKFVSAKFGDRFIL